MALSSGSDPALACKTNQSARAQNDVLLRVGRCVPQRAQRVSNTQFAIHLHCARAQRRVSNSRTAGFDKQIGAACDLSAAREVVGVAQEDEVARVGGGTEHIVDLWPHLQISIPSEHIVNTIEGKVIDAADESIHADTRVPGIRYTGPQCRCHIFDFLTEPATEESPTIANGGQVQCLGKVRLRQLQRRVVDAVEVRVGENGGIEVLV